MRFHETAPRPPEDDDLGPRPLILNLPTTQPDPEAQPEPCTETCCVYMDETGLFC